jgi:cytochrome c biogenesis protein CcmG, thiol:disulfide interchange protein DsbE
MTEATGRRSWFTLSRVFDIVAVLVVLFVAYRLLIAPRFLNSARAYPAPHVTYQTLAGKPFVLTQHRGRVVFLDFWATWCEPCKISLPLVEKYARAHPEVDVIPVNVGESRPVVEAFARSHKMQHVAMDPKSLSQGFFQIEGYPTMVVIDSKGFIRATWPGLNPAIQLNMENARKNLSS